MPAGGALGDGGLARRAAEVAVAAGGRDGRDAHPRRRRPAGGDLHPDAQRADPVVRAHGDPCHPAGLCRDLQGEDDHRFRQHPRPGRDVLPAALAAERPQPPHRAPPRQPRARAAAQGRGGHGRRKLARRRCHIVAGSRRRLGGGRSGRPDRRAEGGEPAGPADRPRRPPVGSHQPGDPGAGQPLRAPGMPRGAAGGGGRCAGRRGAAFRRAGGARPAYPRLRLCRTLRGRCALRGGASSRALCGTLTGRFRRDAALRRKRRLRFGRLRALPSPHPQHRRQLPRGLTPGRPPVPHECRHHRRGGDDAGPAQARPCPGRGGGILHPGAAARRHLRLLRRGPAFRGRPRDDGARVARERGGPQGSRLRRRPAAALHLPR